MSGEPAPSPATSADERGAMALVTVFFAIFAVAMLYSFVGTVEAVFHRERMQDAVDSATLSSAVMHARSMNFVVLVNIVMAALLAILIAIKLVESLAIIGMAIAAALAWPTFGASLAAIPVLKPIQQTMHTTYEEMKPPVERILEQLNALSGLVQSVTPGIAFGLAELNLESNWKPPVDGGVVIGSRTYGKGCAQEYLEDETGAGVVRLTTLVFALPDGTPLQRVGVAPHVALTLPPSSDAEEKQEHAPPPIPDVAAAPPVTSRP